MTLPSIILGIVISTLYGGVFHLFRGGGFWRLILYLGMAWIGFWVGHLLGSRFSWSFLSLGPLNLGMATIGSAVLLIFGYWLSKVEVK
jgi:hypothetical protein